MNDGSEYLTVETVRAGFMRLRGSIAWVIVPFNKAKEESKVCCSFEFLSTLLSGIFNSSFLFLNNRGTPMTSTVKANSHGQEGSEFAIWG